MAHYSFTIALALRTKVQVICARLKENASAFRNFYYVNMSTKSKTDGEFSRVSFDETWQTGSKCFTLVGARKSIRPGFSQC